MVFVIHDLLLSSNVLLWQENNAKYSKKWTRSFKLYANENENYKIQLPSGLINFRIIIVKPYLQKYSYTKILALHNLNNLKSDLV